MIFGTGRGKVVAPGLGKSEKRIGYLHANGVLAMVSWTRAAVAVPIKSGEWLITATLQFTAQYVGAHVQSFGASDTESKTLFRNALVFGSFPHLALLRIDGHVLHKYCNCSSHAMIAQ
jgi:hypothetical protein